MTILVFSIGLAYLVDLIGQMSTGNQDNETILIKPNKFNGEKYDEFVFKDNPGMIYHP